jgi:hypothetical protein
MQNGFWGGRSEEGGPVRVFGLTGLKSQTWGTRPLIAIRLR